MEEGSGYTQADQLPKLAAAGSSSPMAQKIRQGRSNTVLNIRLRKPFRSMNNSVKVQT